MDTEDNKASSAMLATQAIADWLEIILLKASEYRDLPARGVCFFAGMISKQEIRLIIVTGNMNQIKTDRQPAIVEIALDKGGTNTYARRPAETTSPIANPLFSKGKMSPIRVREIIATAVKPLPTKI